MEKKDEKRKNKGGRKSAFKEEYVDLALKFCLLGATDKDLASFFSVSEQTINNWKKIYPEFLESLKKGKNIADANVASSLYRSAIGYSHKDTKLFLNDGKVIKEEFMKHYPPDTTAAIFWLKNRQPEKWRDKKEIENNVKLNDELESMSDAELEAVVRGEK